MEEVDGRSCHGQYHGQYHCHGHKPFVIQQVVGQGEEQKSLTIHVRVPRRKPAIEQIIEVYVKNLHITKVDVITNKVVVCGKFEIKAIYTACKPSQPVHAVEVKMVRFTGEVCIPGARCGMDAEARVVVEFVDYDGDKRSRAHWYKHNYDECNFNPKCGHHEPCDCHHEPCHCHHHEPCGKCMRDFDVFVVLKITAKVLVDREIVVHPVCGIPFKPKG